MEQKRYKILFFKLSGVAFCMVAMVMAGVSIGQNTLFEKSAEATDHTRTFSPLDEQNLNLVFNKNFDIIDEAMVGEFDHTMEDALRVMVDINSIKIEAYSDAIARIAVKADIPARMKKNMIIKLERKLNLSSRKLDQIERRFLVYSTRENRLQSKNNSNSCTKNQKILPKQCDGQCAGNEGSKHAPHGGKDSKRPVETFYWI